MEIIIGKQGNQKIRITEPTVSRKHCKVTSNEDGTYTIENLSQSGTKVDGREIIRATARLNSRIQLGPLFSATLVELIGNPVQSKTTKEEAKSPQSATYSQPTQPKQTQEVKTYNISHLRRVWEDFNETNLEMADKQRKVNLVRIGAAIFTMSSAMVASITTGPIGWVLTGVGIIGNIYSFAGMKNAETAKDRQRRQDEFDDAWVCPNPECGHSLLAKNYKLLVRNHQSCPYCKCKYVEK